MNVQQCTPALPCRADANHLLPSQRTHLCNSPLHQGIPVISVNPLIHSMKQPLLGTGCVPSSNSGDRGESKRNRSSNCVHVTNLRPLTLNDQGEAKSSSHWPVALTTGTQTDEKLIWVLVSLTSVFSHRNNLSFLLNSIEGFQTQKDPGSSSLGSAGLKTQFPGCVQAFSEDGPSGYLKMPF